MKYLPTNEQRPEVGPSFHRLIQRGPVWSCNCGVAYPRPTSKHEAESSQRLHEQLLREYDRANREERPPWQH